MGFHDHTIVARAKRIKGYLLRGCANADPQIIWSSDLFWVLVCISEIWFFMSMGVRARVWGPRCPVRNVFEMVLPRRDLFLHVFGGAEKVSGAQGTRGTSFANDLRKRNWFLHAFGGADNSSGTQGPCQNLDACSWTRGKGFRVPGAKRKYLPND